MVCWSGNIPDIYNIQLKYTKHKLYTTPTNQTSNYNSHNSKVIILIILLLILSQGGAAQFIKVENCEIRNQNVDFFNIVY